MNNPDYDRLRDFITTELASDDIVIDKDTSLFSSRIVSSRNLIRLVSFLEETFGIRVQPFELILENFDSLGRILAYVQMKREDAQA